MTTMKTMKKGDVLKYIETGALVRVERIDGDAVYLRDVESEGGSSTFERIEFTAERDGAWWTLRGPGLPADGIDVIDGDERVVGDSVTIRIQWLETIPPKPGVVEIERGAR